MSPEIERMQGGVWPLVGAERMRALDRFTIDELGVPGEVLMESAGRAVVEVVLERRAACGDPTVTVFCGAGNNGGDGLVVARHLHQLGIPTRVVAAVDDAHLRGDAKANFERARAVGVAIETAEWRPTPGGVLVDALFGTGLSRDVEGPMAEAIHAINQLGALGSQVVAVDLPSGLDADTGQVLGAAVRADATVTISLPKLALVFEPGRSLAGRIHVARIGIADAIPGEIRHEGIDAVSLWAAAAAAARLPRRPRAGHKGSFGHVLVVAGGVGKTGAAALVAHGASRAGAGLVTIGCPSSLNDVLETKCTEAMTVPLPENSARGLAESALSLVVELAAERDVVAIGPGVGVELESQALMRGIAEKVGVPLVIDADGLNAFARDAGALRARPGATVLTPHPGEAARLLSSSPAEVNADRLGAARELAAMTGATVLLKGAGSVTAEPSGRAIVNPTGGPALATGGTGDVLCGVVAAMLAQGLGSLEAAAAAAYLHGAAADAIAAHQGASGLLASQLADALPGAAYRLAQRGREARAPRAVHPGGGEELGGSTGSAGFGGTLLSFPNP